MKRILVIDDDPDILEAIQLILLTEGYETEVTLHGQEALLIALEYEPDLIILDFLLSGTDGKQVSGQLKSAEETSHIPIILLSAHPTARRAVGEGGADGFIAKPFAVSTLVAEVKKLLDSAA